ncbi:unnamed protein product, partial [Allacma fusca]
MSMHDGDIPRLRVHAPSQMNTRLRQNPCRAFLSLLSCLLLCLTFRPGFYTYSHLVR